MFANLKNKLIEEVKASPSKFQQFANAAQAAVSSSSSTTPNSDTNTSNTENFFSITEEDTPQNSPYRIQKLPATSASSLRGRSTQSLNGATSRTRKLSNSSMASDVSFRLPTYEAPAVYHLQSDLDETSSEFDDSASTARLDVITKDQLYDAYKKSLDRYHKYRCRYTDLAKKYKELERDSSKARSVLVETQDKALRRISELREQCTLEQQAKAHLEEALRIEMDDMSCKMQAYQTKLQLLGENPENITAALERSGHLLDTEQLIDLDESTGKSAPPENGGSSEDASNLQRLLKEREAQLKDVTEKYDALRKQEEENVLLLAQTKQAIHTELEHKDNEVRQLQEKLKQLESQRESHSNEAKEQFRKLQATKQEVDAKLMATEHLLNSLKGNYATKEQQVAALEKQLETIKTESEQKLKDLQQQNEDRENQASDSNEQLQKLQSAKKEAESQLSTKEQLLESLRSETSAKDQQLKNLEEQLDVLKKRNETNLDELRQSKEASTSQNSEAHDQLRKLQAAKEEAESKLLNTEELLNTLRNDHKTKEEQLAKLEKNLKTVTEEHESNLLKLRQVNEHSESKFTDAQEKLVNLEAAKNEAEAKLLSTELSLNALQAALSAKEEQSSSLEKQLNALQTESEHSLQDMRLQNDQLLEIVQRHQQNDWEAQLDQAREELITLQSQREQHTLELEKSLEMERESLAALSSEKTSLEEQHKLKLEQLQREIQILQDQHANSESDTVAALKAQLEAISQDLATSRASLLAKEKELKASGNKLNKIKKQHEQHQAKSSEQSASLETLQSELADRINHSRQVESEKEELQTRVTGILEEIGTMQAQMQQVQDSHSELEREKRKLESHIESLQQEQVDSSAQDERTAAKLEEIQSENTKLAERNCLLEEQSNHLESQLQAKQDEMGKIQVKMQQVLDEHSKLQNAQELMDHDHRTLQDKCDAYEKDKLLTKDTLDCIQVASEELQQAKANLERDLEEQQQQLLELRERQREQEQQLSDQADRCAELEAQNTESESQLQATISNLREQLDSHKQSEQGIQEKIQATSASFAAQIATLEARWSAANSDVERLHEANDALQLEMDQLKIKHSQEREVVKESVAQKNRQVVELQEAMALRDRQLKDKVDASEKLAKIDEIQIENEYLNKHTKQLEKELAEAAEVKEKLKSLQCELYVLQEKAEQHAVQMSEKETQSAAATAECSELKKAIEEQAVELTRQKEHASFVTDQSDAVQKDLLQAQQLLQDTQSELTKSQEEQNRLQATVESLNQEVTSLKDQSSASSDSDSLRSLNERLQRELEDLKHKSDGAESNMQQEIEELQANNQQMAERINELEALRAGIQAQQLLASMAPKNVQEAAAAGEKAELEAKLKEIMNEVQDVTNRNLFLEQKCENYLILEQSNERLKLQNAKLSRQLDETLVSMQHSEAVPANTEFEYLRNIMFQYLTGNTNNETLVKVISAVLKFSPQQAQVALEKEHQRRSLLNKLI
uniref:Golgin subfamily A member 4 n=1 Tax=Drosophila rhopaloa TaxID=1041015 RepID=A0A6P4FDG4_DRORH